MIGLMFAMLMLSGFSVFGAAVLKKRFEETLPLAVMGIVAILFCFYIFNFVNIGFYFVLTLCIGCYIAALVYVIKKKELKSALQHFFTPGLLVFIILLISYILIQKGNAVKWWDELRLWAATPKSIFYTGKLQLGEEAYLFPSMQSYPPGMPLFQFFFSKVSGSFNDFRLFLGYSIVGAVMMLEVTKRLKWRQAVLCFPLTILLLLFPLMAFNSNFDYANYYDSLFIDPILGITIAYLMYQLIDNVFQDLFHLIKFTLTLFFIISLKDSGLMFAIVAVISAVIMKFSVYRLQKRDKVWQCLIPVVGCLLAYIPWKIVLHANGVIASSSNQLSKKNSLLGLFFHPNSEQTTAVKEFVHALDKTPVIIQENLLLPFELTVKNLFLLMLIFGILIGFIVKKKHKSKFIIPFVSIIVAGFFYIVGLAVLYANSLGAKLPSYERYISVIILAFGAFLFFSVIELLGERECMSIKGKTCLRQISLLFTMLLIMITPMKKYETPDYTLRASNDAKRYTNIIRNNVDLAIKEPRIFYVGDNDLGGTSQRHHMTYYNLIAENIIVKNTFWQTNIIYDDVEASKKEWTDLLIEQKIDYVLFTKQMEEIAVRYSSMFSDGKYQIDCLYKVIKTEDNSVLLEPVRKIS